MHRPLLAALALAALATPFLSPPASSAPAPAGPGAVVSMHIQLFRALDGADAKKAASFVGPATQATLFFDRDETPELVRGRKAVAERLGEWASESQLGSWSTVVKPIASDCYSEHLSYAVLEIERSMMSTAGTPMVVETYLSTSLVQYRDGGWKLLHWHLSPAAPIDPALRPSSERNARAEQSGG